jgi:hypothetical protein
MVLLCNLSKFYKNLIVTLKSQTNIDFNIEFVTIKLLHGKLKKENEGSNEGGSALVACTSKPTTSNLSIDQKATSKKDKEKNLCNYCKKLGH